MKIFVAGISVNRNLRCMGAKYIRKNLAGFIPTIINESNDSVGEDAITIIVLPEYALTKKPIQNSVKKECIEILREAIKPYNNVILVPGSFASYQIIGENKSNFFKVKANYENLASSYIGKIKSNS